MKGIKKGIDPVAKLGMWLAKGELQPPARLAPEGDPEPVDALSAWLAKACPGMPKKKKKLSKDEPASIASSGVGASTQSASGASTVANYFRNR